MSKAEEGFRMIQTNISIILLKINTTTSLLENFYKHSNFQAKWFMRLSSDLHNSPLHLKVQQLPKSIKKEEGQDMHLSLTPKIILSPS